MARRCGKRERHLLEPVDAGDLLDQVDLAGHVAGAPGRDRDRPSSPRDLEAEPLEDRRAARRAGISSPTSASVRSGRSRVTGRAGSSPWTSLAPVQRAPVSSTSSCVA